MRIYAGTARPNLIEISQAQILGTFDIKKCFALIDFLAFLHSLLQLDFSL